MLVTALSPHIVDPKTMVGDPRRDLWLARANGRTRG
jgi:hypothetical protein